MWAVVNFLTENTVESVPIKWVIERSQECFWPPKNTPRKKIRDAIQKCEDPGSEWQIFKIRILGEYDNYSKALKKASKATISTDLSSANEEYIPRPKKIRKTVESTSSSDESNILSDEDTLQYPVLNVASASSSSQPKSHTHTPEIVLPSARKIFNTPSGTPKSTFIAAKSLNKKSDINKATCCNKTAQDDEDADFKKQILRQLFIIRNLIEQQNDVIDVLIKRNTNTTDSGNDDATGFEEFTHNIRMLPVKTENDLEIFENFLKDSENNMKSMAKYLARIGGNNVKEIVRRIMYNIFGNEVGMLFSWEGAKKKKIFKNLNTSKCIFDAVRMNTRTEKAQDDEIIVQIKGWLVRSKERMIQFEKKNNPERIHE